MTGLRLHLPSEPDVQRWRTRVLEHATLDEVIEKEDGVAAWLWDRWRALERHGMDEAAFVAVAAGYRREIWLWLMGERTWAHCCAGLAGRAERRLASA